MKLNEDEANRRWCGLSWSRSSSVGWDWERRGREEQEVFVGGVDSDNQSDARSGRMLMVRLHERDVSWRRVHIRICNELVVENAVV